MNRQKVLVNINDVIVGRITEIIEGMSTNDFVETICQKNEIDLNDEESVDEVRNLIGSRVIPLYVKMSEYITEVDFFEELTKGVE